MGKKIRGVFQNIVEEKPRGGGFEGRGVWERKKLAKGWGCLFWGKASTGSTGKSRKCCFRPKD